MASRREEYLRQLKEEKLLRLKRERYKTDPLFWLEDRFGESRESFAWSEIEGYEKHEWDGDKDPLAQAWQVLGDGYKKVRDGGIADFRYVAIESATGCSKTYWLARLAFWFLDSFENSLVVTSAPKRDQLRLGLWSEISMLGKKIKKIRPNAQMYKLRLAMDDKKIEEDDVDDVVMSDSWHCVGFIAGAGADDTSADKARGFHRKNMLIIAEECTGIHPAIMTAFQNTSTGLTNFIVAVGNPNNEFDPLHQFAMQNDVKHFRISAFDYPNIVLNREHFSGAVTWASINSRTDVYGEGSPLWSAMVRGISPTQAADSLIKLDWIEQCVDREIPELTGYNAVGVDVANSENGDKAALAWGEANILKEIEEFACPNATHLAYNLMYDESELMLKGYSNYGTKKLKDFNIMAECIGIDSVGVGAATVNAFLDHNYYVLALSGGQDSDVIPKEEIWDAGKKKERNMYSFSSLRSQMYWELREDLRKGNISIQIKDPEKLKQLKKELCIIKFQANSAHIEVEKKENIKKRLGNKSPNVADAVAYWNWTRKGYKVDTQGFPAMGAFDESEY